jgi:hypothetical protein
VRHIGNAVLAPGENALSLAVAAAAQPGAAAPPDELLALLANEESPLAALADRDKGNALFEAFNNQFGFISFNRVRRQPCSPEQLERWAGLIRWIAAEFRDWRRADDPKRARLVAVIVAAQSCDQDNDFWNAVWDGLGGSEMVQAMADLLAGLNVQIATPGILGLAISEAEEVARFVKADAAGDWTTVADCLMRAGPMLPSALVNQVVRCANRFGFERLVAATASLRQSLGAIQIANALSTADRLGLAIASENFYLRFICLFRTVLQQPGAPHLSRAEEDLVTELLLKVAADAEQWRLSMQAFNRFPTRYGLLQAPLGRALALTPEEAVAAYVESINLSIPIPQTRRCVAECCHAFKEAADGARRRLLWGLAFERWSAWDFNAADGDKHLVNITVSELDFAVVGYAVECLDETQRGEAMTRIARELAIIDDEWHASFSDCLTAWNRLLSRFQPYAHAASAVASGTDWLAEGRHYYFYEPRNERYLTMMYRVR